MTVLGWVLVGLIVLLVAMVAGVNFRLNDLGEKYNKFLEVAKSCDIYNAQQLDKHEDRLNALECSKAPRPEPAELPEPHWLRHLRKELASNGTDLELAMLTNYTYRADVMDAELVVELRLPRKKATRDAKTEPA